jgi:phosphoserine phosphatase
MERSLGGNGRPVSRPEVLSPRQAAAFYRVEGALVRRPSLAAAAYFAANAQGPGGRLTRLGTVALAAPFALAARMTAGDTAARATWMCVRGLGEDRIVELAEEYFDRFLRPNVTELGRDLIERSRKRGHRVVLISDHIERIVAPLGELLGADDVVCNRLEVKRGEATGRLLEPVVSSVSGQWAREYAASHGVDLDSSCAYGATAADGLLLSAIGQPCAVTPDRLLRQMARDHQWPVVDV